MHIDVTKKHQELRPCGHVPTLGSDMTDVDLGRGDDAVGNPDRAQISQFELFELILLLKLDKQFPVEQFEAAGSQSTVPFPPLKI